MNYELEARSDSRKSFYKKARVEVLDNGDKILTSYNTEVAKIINGKAIVLGQWSQTTSRHIKEFLKQEGFKVDDTKQVMKDYGVKN